MELLTEKLKEKINKEREHFKKILEYYVPNPNTGVKILNICCGPVTEEPILIDFFKPSKLISIDHYKGEEEWAKKYGTESFIYGDIHRLDEFLDESEKFDFLFGRNIPLSPGGHGTCPDGYLQFPPYYKPIDNNDEWYNTFYNLKKYFLENSTFFLTFLRNDEFFRGKEILKKAGYKIRKAEENKHPCPSDGIGVVNETKDYYVILGKIK